MATRRHRIVIKPNIRPAAGKASSSSSSKSKVGAETPGTGSKTQQSQQSIEDVHQTCHETEEKTKPVPVASDSEGYDTQTADPSIPKRDASQSSALPGSDIEKKVSSSAKETKISTLIHGEISHKLKEKRQVHSEEASTLASSLKPPSSTEIITPVPSNEQQTSGSQLPKDSTQTAGQGNVLNGEDVTDSADVTQSRETEDGAEATPSEADPSNVSEALSLEGEEERRGEVDDDAQKKPRRRRSKKQRAEPLPSREKSPDRQKMKMSDLLSWNPQQNYLPRKNKKKTPLKDENRAASPSSPTMIDDEDKESTNQSASLPAPQVMIGPDGNIVLNTESLMIQTPLDETKSKEIIEEDDDDRYLNTNTYRKHKKSKLWTERETERFFLGLSMCGTDFSLLTNLMTHRSRRELKNKFAREERRNRHLIDKALANRQHYDIKPFEKMAADDEKKVKKEVKKRVKKENVADKKSENTVKRKPGRKRKRSDSEDEEDDWGPEYDEEDEDEEDDIQDTVGVTTVKQKKQSVKKEIVYPNKPFPSYTMSSTIKENKNIPFVPGMGSPMAGSEHTRDLSNTQSVDDEDLDQPRMNSKPLKTYSRQNRTNPVQIANTTSGYNPSVTSNRTGASSNPINAIPGSSQVQIEMEGVQNPVQGVLIPSHIVPQIAPQLGIPGNAAGMQILLVQEEADSGSLVHVYVIPESDSPRPSTSNVAVSTTRAHSHPVLSSPIPSPHPTTPIYSSHPASPYPSTQTSHPLAPIRSPNPPPPIQSPPPIHSSQPHTFVHRPRPQGPISHAPKPPDSLVQNLFSMTPNSNDSRTHVPLSSATPSSFGSSIRPSTNATANINNRQVTGINVDTSPAITTNNTTHPSSQNLPDTRKPSSSAQSVAVIISNPSINRTQPLCSKTAVASNSPSYQSDVQCVAVDGTASQKGITTVTGTVSGPSMSVAKEDSEIDDGDCVILNSDKPQSQLDRSAMSNL